MTATRKWAVAQMNAGIHRRENLERACELVEEAANEGCSLLALPEFFLVRGRKDTILDQAVGLEDPPIQRLCQAASEAGINLLAGSVPVRHPEDPDRCFNTSLCIDSSGEILAEYRKIHLFDVDLEGGITVRESSYLSPGEEVVTAEFDGLPVGLTICYDLRFPELYRELTERGATVLFVPSNFTRETGRAHWEPLLRARAIENQCYVVAPNQIGSNEETGVPSYGHSLVVDPWGQIVARASDQTGWFSVRLDPDYLEQTRRELPCLDHRTLT